MQSHDSVAVLNKLNLPLFAALKKVLIEDWTREDDGDDILGGRSEVEEDEEVVETKATVKSLRFF